MAQAFEITDDDIRIVAGKHDTFLTDAQVEEVMDALDAVDI